MNTKTETVSKETVFFWPKILKKGGFCGIMLHIASYILDGLCLEMNKIVTLCQ